ncbi:MAG: ABC transporter permease subunit [Acinetobacter sp.]
MQTFSATPKKKNNFARDLKRGRLLYLMLVPSFLWVLCFRLLPIPGIQVAFRDFNIYDGIWGSSWVGLKYFQQMFSQQRFLNVIENTLEISILKLLVLFPIPIIMALMLNEFKHKWYQRSVQVIIYLPHFLSYVVIHGIFTNLLSTQNGLVNNLIASLGFDKVNFYSNSLFRFVLILTEGFKDFGWNTIIYLSALSAIDMQLYEAAEVDGAGKLKQMWHITLPSLMPIVMLMLTLRVGNIMQTGTDQILVMYNASVYQTADVIGTFVYREGIGSGKFSLSAAVGLFESVVAFVLIMGTNFICKHGFQRGLW